MDFRRSPKQKPLIIAHRGYSGLLPENTLQSIETALYKSDLVQFDILLTKDKQVVIFHDRYLSKRTDIANFEQFRNKKRVSSYHVEQSQSTRDDWWLHDFTAQQLTMLKVKQVFEQRPQFKNLAFKIPTLENVIREIQYIKKQRLPNNKCGFLIEIKSLWEDKDDHWDELIVEKLVQILKRSGLDTQQRCTQQRFPVIIQSFNHKIVKQISKSELQLPIIHLFDRKDLNKEMLLAHSVQRMIGIGISEAHATKQIKQFCQQLNLSMFYWTLRDDQPKSPPFALKTFKEVYMHLLELGVNGLITQFPEKCEEYINQYWRIHHN